MNQLATEYAQAAYTAMKAIRAAYGHARMVLGGHTIKLYPSGRVVVISLADVKSYDHLEAFASAYGLS